MKKVLICLLFLSCNTKSDYEIYQVKYDSVVEVLDMQIRLSEFYFIRGKETKDDKYYLLADSVILEAEKSLFIADSFNIKMKGYALHNKLGDSSNNWNGNVSP